MAKIYVEEDGLDFMINTSIANTDYISNVIKAYVYGDTSATEQLYEEPVRSDAEQEAWDRLIKQFGKTPSQRELERQRNMEEIVKKNQVKQDNTRVVVPKSLFKK